MWEDKIFQLQWVQSMCFAIMCRSKVCCKEFWCILSDLYIQLEQSKICSYDLDIPCRGRHIEINQKITRRQFTQPNYRYPNNSNNSNNSSSCGIIWQYILSFFRLLCAPSLRTWVAATFACSKLEGCALWKRCFGRANWGSRVQYCGVTPSLW